MGVIAMWWLTLGIGAVVIVVVAALLVWIARAAERIDRHALDIWQAGKSIATNTVQIWQLQQTNQTAGEILTTASTIATVAQSIDGRLERLVAALNKGV